MNKNTRHHFPCRVCNKKHTNPASSSVCNECGPAVALKNRRLKAEMEALERELENNEDFV